MGPGHQSSLKGLKVVEVASVLAGPAVGMFFAELGADVIKIENKRSGGDVTRHWKLPVEDPEAEFSAYYASVNWGKTSVMLDLKDEGDLNKLHEYLEDADVLITNFKKGQAAKYKLDADYIRKQYPRLITGNITGYGEESVKGAYDIVLQAETGYLHLTGHPGHPPAKMPVALIDVLTAHQLKEGILLALLERSQTGKGAYVSVSLFETALSSLTNQATNWLNAGFSPHRMGSQHPNIAPYGELFRTSDNKLLVLAVGSDDQFTALLEVLGLRHLALDSRFEHNQGRVQNREALADMMAPVIKMAPSDKLSESLNAANVPHGIVKGVKEALEHPLAKSLILKDERGFTSLKTALFHINSN